MVTRSAGGAVCEKVVLPISNNRASDRIRFIAKYITKIYWIYKIAGFLRLQYAATIEVLYTSVNVYSSSNFNHFPGIGRYAGSNSGRFSGVECNTGSNFGRFAGIIGYAGSNKFSQVAYF